MARTKPQWTVLGPYGTRKDQKQKSIHESKRSDRELDDYLKRNNLAEYKPFLKEYRNQIETGAMLFDPKAIYIGFSKNIPADKTALAALLPIFIASLTRGLEVAPIAGNNTALGMGGRRGKLQELTGGSLYNASSGTDEPTVSSLGMFDDAGMLGGGNSSSNSKPRKNAGQRALALRGARLGKAPAKSLDEIREEELKSKQASPTPLPTAKARASIEVQTSARQSTSQLPKTEGKVGGAREDAAAVEKGVLQSESARLDKVPPPKLSPEARPRDLLGRSSGAGFGIKYLSPTNPAYFGEGREDQPTYLGGLGSEVCVISDESPLQASNDFTAFPIQGNAVKITDSQWLLGKYIFTQDGCGNITVTQDSWYDSKGSPLRPPTLAVISGNLDVDEERANNRFGVTFGQDVASPTMSPGAFKPPIELDGYHITKPVIIPLDSRDGRFGIMTFNGNHASALNYFATYARNGAVIGSANLGRGYPDRPEQLLLISDPDAETRALFVADDCRIYSIDKYGNFAMGGYIDEFGNFFPEGQDLIFVYRNGFDVCFADRYSKPSLAKYNNGQYYFLFKDTSGNVVKHIPIYSNGHFKSSSFVMGSPPGVPIVSEAADRVTLSTGDVAFVDVEGPSPKVRIKQAVTTDSADQPPCYFVDGLQDARPAQVQRAVFPFPEPGTPNSLLNLSEVADNSLTYVSGYFLHSSIALPLSARGSADVTYGTIAEVDFPVSGLPFSIDSLLQRVREQKPVSSGLKTYAVAVFPGNKVVIFPDIKTKGDLKTIVESSPSFVFNPVITRSATATIEKTSSRSVTKTTSVCAGVTTTKTVTSTPDSTVSVTQTTSSSGTVTVTSTTTPTRSPSGTATTKSSSTVTVTVTRSSSGEITGSSTTTSTVTSTTTPSESGTGSKTVTVTQTTSPSGTVTKTKTSTTTPLPSGKGSVTQSSSITTSSSGKVIARKTSTKSTTRTRSGTKSIKVSDTTGGNNKVPIIAGSIGGAVAATIASWLAYLYCKRKKDKVAPTPRTGGEAASGDVVVEVGKEDPLAGLAAPPMASTKPKIPPMAGRSDIDLGAFAGVVGGQDDIDMDEEGNGKPIAPSVARGIKASELLRSPIPSARKGGVLDGVDPEVKGSERGLRAGAAEGSTADIKVDDDRGRVSATASTPFEGGKYKLPPINRRGGNPFAGIDLSIDGEPTAASVAHGIKASELLRSPLPSIRKGGVLDGFDPEVEGSEGGLMAGAAEGSTADIKGDDDRGRLAATASTAFEADVYNLPPINTVDDALQGAKQDPDDLSTDKSLPRAGNSYPGLDIVGRIMAANADSVAGGQMLFSPNLSSNSRGRGFLLGTDPGTEHLKDGDGGLRMGVVPTSVTRGVVGRREASERGITFADDIGVESGRDAPVSASANPPTIIAPHSHRIRDGEGDGHIDLEGRTLPAGNGISTVPEGPADTSHDLDSASFIRVKRGDKLDDGKLSTDKDIMVVEDIEGNKKMEGPEGDAASATANSLFPISQSHRL